MQAAPGGLQRQKLWRVKNLVQLRADGGIDLAKAMSVADGLARGQCGAERRYASGEGARMEILKPVEGQIERKAFAPLRQEVPHFAPQTGANRRHEYVESLPCHVTEVAISDGWPLVARPTREITQYADDEWQRATGLAVSRYDLVDPACVHFRFRQIHWHSERAGAGNAYTRTRLRQRRRSRAR